MAILFQLPRAVPISAGEGYAGAKCHFYQAGTTTNITTYTTPALSVAHANPVVADANGVFAAIYINEAVNTTFKVRLVTSSDVLIYEEDNLIANSYVRLPDGSFSAPSIAFLNDPDTGFYRISADDIGLVLGGSLGWRQYNIGGITRFSLFSGFITGNANVEIANASTRSASNPYIYIGISSAGTFYMQGFGDDAYQGSMNLQFASIVLGGSVFYPGVITPTQLTADTHNWNPTGLTACSVIRVSTDASRTLTGITTFANGAKILICNVGSQDLVLAHDSASSSASNRFFCPGNSSFTLNQNDSTHIWYDSSSGRWRVIAA